MKIQTSELPLGMQCTINILEWKPGLVISHWSTHLPKARAWLDRIAVLLSEFGLYLYTHTYFFTYINTMTRE